MKKIVIAFILLFNISYGINQQKTNNTIIVENTIKQDSINYNNSYTVADKDYQFTFNIEKDKAQKYFLVITVKLYNNSFYISPNAKANTTDKLDINLGSYKDIAFDGAIIELRSSNEHINTSPIADTDNVRVTTVYKIPIKIISKENFEVFGKVEFYLNPRNTYEVVPFAISFKNGKFGLYPPKC